MSQFVPVEDEPQVAVKPLELESTDEVLGTLKVVLFLIGVIAIIPFVVGYLLAELF